MGKSTQEQLICDYCGERKKEVSFFIGASPVPSWVMNEGSGKISCPLCFELGKAEGKKCIDAHVRAVNKGGG